MLEKDLEGQGCEWQLKSFIHTPKPQIPSVELRKRRLGIRTIPWVFLVKREESRTFDVLFLFYFFFMVFVCVLVFGREKNVQKNQVENKTKKKKNVILLQSEGSLGLLQPETNLKVVALIGPPIPLKGVPASNLLRSG